MVKLPLEILLMICELLIHNGQTNKDLLTAGQLNRAFNSAAKKLLFKHITLTFSLKDVLPSQIEPWQPHGWETPALVELLRKSSELRECVRSVRLRVCPFPVQDWSSESFNNMKKRLRANTENYGTENGIPRYDHLRDFRQNNLKTGPGRQRFVAVGYTVVFVRRCDGRNSMPWTQDIARVLQELLAQLPGLQHLETAGADSPPILSRVHSPMCRWGASLADALILQTAPQSVRSITFRSWPPFQLLSYQEDRMLETLNNRRLSDFTRIGAQIKELTLDSSHSPLHVPLGYNHGQLEVLTRWRPGLQQLVNLTKLALHQEPRTQVGDVLPRLALTGKLDPKLDHLFNKALILQHVKFLTLSYWIVPAAVFANAIRSSCPALTRLHLQGIAMLSNNYQAGEQQWDQFVSSLKQSKRIIIVVERPRICNRGNPWDHSVYEMDEQPALALQGRLGQ